MTHQLRYLLIFGDRKKKVELTVSQDLENVKVETLKQKARELFSLKNVLLQIWDKGFEDWVDLDEGDPTPTNSRIKVELDKDASSAAAVKPKPPPVTLIPNPKVDSPAVVRGLSSHGESYSPISLTTSELPMVVPTQKSLSSKLKPSKQSSRKLTSGGLKRHLVEQPPGLSTTAHDVGSGQAIQDISNNITRTCHQSYPTPTHAQDRPVLENIQQSLLLSPRIPLQRSQEDILTRTPTSNFQNKPVMEVRTVEDDLSSSTSQEKDQNEDIEWIPERNRPPLTFSQDHLNQQAMSYSNNRPTKGVAQQSSASHLYNKTSEILDNTLPLCHDNASSSKTDKESANKAHEDNEADHIIAVLMSDPDKPSLYSYKLPTFPADIIEKVENGIPIEARDRSILLETLYESIVPYTYYPSAADYIYFTKLFLERYPQLLPQAGTIRDCPDNREAWRQKLMHMFKNKRKRKDRDVAAVQQHTRKNFRYFEGLDELQGTSGQAWDGNGDRVQSNTPSEADEEVFEVVDDDQDVLIKEEDSMYNVVAADSTNLDDTSAIRIVQESISSSPYVQSSRIPETNVFITYENEHCRPTVTHSSNETCNEIPKDLPTLPTYTERSSPLPLQMHKRSFPHSHQYKVYEQSTEHLQKEPVMRVVQESCLPKANMDTSRIPENAFHISRDHASSTIINQGSSSNKCTEDRPNDVDPIMSALTSNPDKPSLYSYKLPTFPADIIEKLENGIPIEARDRSILLETLYESIVPYTYYPSAADYIYFTKLFLERYPQLLPQAGPIRDCPDNVEAWRQKLMHKFKNKRKRRDRDVAVVQLHARKNLRYFEGLNELQDTSGQAWDGNRDRVQSNTPSEADEEVFEVMDDDQDVLIKEDDSMYHVVAADSTNLDDTSAIGVVQESISSSPFMQSSRIPETNMFITHENEHCQPTATHSSNEPCNKILKDLPPLPTYKQTLPLPSQMQSSAILERSLPHSHPYKCDEQSIEHMPQEPVMRVVQEPFLSKANVETSRNPENAFHPSRDHASSTIINEGSSSNKCQEDRPNDIDPMSVLTSDPDKPSLYSYKLPMFPAYIMEKLENGVPIEAQDRSILLEIVYESIVPYTYYPSAADYAYFTTLFLERYPQLVPQAGPIRDCPDNWEAWRQKLMHKFKNKRKRKDRDVDVVQQHTRKNVRYFEGLDELQDTSEQAIGGSGDQEDSNAPSQTDEEFFEVIDVVIKEEDSNHHVMAADTANPGHT